MVICYIYAIQEFGVMGAAYVTSIFRLGKAAIAQVAAWRWANSPAASPMASPTPALIADPTQGVV
jgi:hypothetical protein